VPAKLSSQAIEVGIVVRDVDRSLAFYRDVLGLPYLGDLDFSVARMWRFQAGSSVVKLLLFREEATASNPPGDVTATGYRYLSLFVSNLEELVEECSQFGAAVPIPVTEFRPGSRFAFVEDPEGNRIELLEVNE
jgi:catechol 2,3-dioxygenase-like lactoylglutathione lyase family enzyme